MTNQIVEEMQYRLEHLYPGKFMGRNARPLAQSMAGLQGAPDAAAFNRFDTDLRAYLDELVEYDEDITGGSTTTISALQSEISDLEEEVNSLEAKLGSKPHVRVSRHHDLIREIRKVGTQTNHDYTMLAKMIDKFNNDTKDSA